MLKTSKFPLLRPLVAEGLRYARHDNLLYLKNPKCACSSVLESMIRRIGQVEGIALPEVLSPRQVHGNGPWWSKQFKRFRRIPPRTFSIVRNPYVRLLSAYLDKIARRDIVGRQFRVSLGIDPDAPLGFSEFLRLLDPRLQVFDQHWRPQVQLLMVGHLRIDRVHFLENLGDTVGDLEGFLDRRVAFGIRNRHATGSAERLADYYTEADAALVQRIYADDFATFGYPTELDRAGDAPGTFIRIDAEGTGSLRTLELLGCLMTDAPATRLQRIAGRGPLSLVDRLLLHSRADAVSLTDPDRLERDLSGRAAAADASPFDRVLLHQFRLQQARHAADQAAEAVALQDLARILPFAAVNRFQLVRCLIASGEREAARGVLATLECATLQRDELEKVRALLG